jgi:beta-glucosidase
MKMRFPDGFLFGAALSAHQAEGNNRHADWWQWEEANAERLARTVNAQTNFDQGPLPAHSWQRIEALARDPANYHSGDAADHWHRYREDLALAQSLGLNAFRFSIEWARLEPMPGVFDPEALAHYADVVAECHRLGLEPMVTLWHFTLPAWVAADGGWTNPRTVGRFVRYVQYVANGLPGPVLWATMNEPESYLLLAYLRRRWPHSGRTALSLFPVRRHLVEAHHQAVEAIKAIRPEARVGMSFHIAYFERSPGLLSPLSQLTNFIAEHLFNTYFISRCQASCDWLGLQYYFHCRTKGGVPFGGNTNAHRSDLGWELYPQGVEPLLAHLAPYNKPIYVTESGLADAQDRYRANYIRQTLAAIWRARQNGADVRGYLHWSLIDNFEWDKGRWPRFGLVEVDYATQERTIRPSAKHYAQIARSGELDLT